MSNKITVKNIFRHLHTVNKHRFKVFLLCCKVGIPIQGLLHDMSKYSPTEFWESVKYFQGHRSPIVSCKEENGYSKAWLHHKGRNKHHYEYWYDYNAPVKSPVMPFKYFLEMVCDSLAAGMVYRGKQWTKSYQLTYWRKTKLKAKIHPKMIKLLDKVYKEISINGIKKGLTKKKMKELYDKYTEDKQNDPSRKK